LHHQVVSVSHKFAAQKTCKKISRGASGERERERQRERERERERVGEIDPEHGGDHG
jgi:hypothetical protein